MLKASKRIRENPIFESDEERRRGLLNILLIFVLFLFIPVGLSAWISTRYGSYLRWIFDAGIYGDRPDVVAFSAGGVSFFSLIAFVLNRSRRLPAPRLVAFGFIVIITLFIVLSDSPSEVIAGRTSFFLLVPIFLASELVYPFSGILVAFCELAALAAIAPQNIAVSQFSVAMIYLFSLLTWVSAQKTQNAIAAAFREGVKNNSILASTGDGIIVFSQDGQLQQINQAAEKLLGPRPPKEVFDLVQKEWVEKNYPEPIKVGWEKSTLAITPAAMMEQGEQTGFVFSIRDYTREAIVERMKDSVLGIVSHELRTPISAIKGFADLLKLRGLQDSMTNDAVQSIQANVERLLFLVNDLVDQASIQAGTIKIIPSEFLVTSLVERVRSVVLQKAEDKGLPLEIVVEKGMPEKLVGDVDRLWQVIVNLVGNAIKFTENGRVDVRLYAGGDSWFIEVKDTGIGIPEQNLEFIFEPLRRTPDYATRKHQGAGLGLSITKQLVQLMGGSIQVESEVGKGSTFTVKLPLVQKQRKE